MLKIDNLEIKSRKKRVLIAPYAIFESGISYLVLGKNNSGKSLFLKAIAGQYKAVSGDINWKEKKIFSSRFACSSIFLERNCHLLPEKTVWENLCLPFSKVTSRIKNKLTEYCHTAGISYNIETKAGHLSYSDQKFIELIRTAVQIPNIILLDDVDTYFDEINYNKALHILQSCLKNNSILIATSRSLLENFHHTLRIQNKELLFL
ncbi:MAG: ATP-binding cassette domain-containing protein [Candidatus Cloacimonadota bacterium]|nr:ATP-binding cassette domain-containing protein [Candidatus Cloacimonadota bacterium]